MGKDIHDMSVEELTQLEAQAREAVTQGEWAAKTLVVLAEIKIMREKIAVARIELEAMKAVLEEEG